MIDRFFSKSLILSIVSIAFVISAGPVRASDPTACAVLPFQTNSDTDMSFAQKGISRMFYSRLSWPDKVMIVPLVTIARDLKEIGAVSGDRLIQKVAEKTGSQYVLTGSVTQLAGSFSIDAKIYDIPNKRYMAFFEQSKDSQELIDKVDRIAASINQEVFHRSTVTWEKMEQERQKQINDYKRKNPEYLMALPPNYKQKEKIGWKIWKYIF